MLGTAEAVWVDDLNNAGGGVASASAYCYWMVTMAASKSEGSQAFTRNIKHSSTLSISLIIHKHN